MGFFDIFRRSGEPRTKYAAVPINVNTWTYKTFDGSMLTVDLFVACVDALARNIAKMDLKSVRRKDDFTSTTDNTSDVARVLRHPNEYMTEYDFLYKIAAQYFVNGNAFVFPEYDENGNLLALWPINYQAFHLYKETNGVLIAQFQLNYWHEYTVPYSRLIHLRNHYINDDLLGDGNASLEPVAELLNAQNQGIINGIKNSALIRGILKSVQVIKRDDLRAARNQFVEDNLRASNNGGVIVVDGKFDYQNISSQPYVIDAATMEETTKKVFNYLGVNEEFLQNSFNSDGYEAVYEGRLEPFAIMLSQAFTHSLFTDRERGFGNAIEANMAKVKYQPMAAVSKMIAETKELGLFTRDEYREMLGYEPLGEERGGNDIMIAQNNYTSLEDTEK